MLFLKKEKPHGFSSRWRGIRENSLVFLCPSADGGWGDEKEETLDFIAEIKRSTWCHQESNRGHKDFQSFALPTEL